jgi:hypothetical protein
MRMSRLFRLVLGVVLSGLVSPPAFGQWAATKIVPQPTHKCDDPVPGGDMVKTIEIADQKDGAPHANGAAGNWYVTRMTKWIPYCMYHDPIGLYSLDTYSLTPKFIEEEVQICEALAGGGSRPVAPFAGPCPPPH